MPDILEVMRTDEFTQNTYEYLTESLPFYKKQKWDSRFWQVGGTNSDGILAIRNGESQFADSMKTPNMDIPVIMGKIGCIDLWVKRDGLMHRYWFDVDMYRRNLIFRDDIMSIPEETLNALGTFGIYRMTTLRRNTMTI